MFKHILATLAIAGITGCTTMKQEDYNKEEPFIKREFKPQIEGNWIGNGISYGAYRDGEGPNNGTLTSKENILEDLILVSKRWNLIRMYGSGPQSERIIEVIRDNKLSIKVMLGAWIDGNWTKEKNDNQVEQLIELANKYPEIVIVVNVGNEIFVDWSYHRIKDEKGIAGVIQYIREVRSKIKQPVTVNDDYNFWNKPHAKRIADEIDFIGLHAYAFWNSITLKESMKWTKEIYQDISKRHPNHTIAYCETGWPTSRVYGDGSHEGGLTGKAGEDQQKVFFDEYNKWINKEKVISFYFEAFDEKWKGGSDGKNPMDKAEKHWGVYNSDRTPKKVFK